MCVDYFEGSSLVFPEFFTEKNDFLCIKNRTPNCAEFLCFAGSTKRGHAVRGGHESLRFKASFVGKRSLAWPCKG